MVSSFDALKLFAKGEIAKCPGAKHAILDLVELAACEIDEGGSMEHECELAESSIKDVVAYEIRVRKLEAEGISRSDAQGIVDVNGDK